MKKEQVNETKERKSLKEVERIKDKLNDMWKLHVRIEWNIRRDFYAYYINTLFEIFN